MIEYVKKFEGFLNESVIDNMIKDIKKELKIKKIDYIDILSKQNSVIVIIEDDQLPSDNFYDIMEPISTSYGINIIDGDKDNIKRLKSEGYVSH